MTRLVVDASVAVEYLLRTPLGMTVANALNRTSLVAPGLMDAEVMSGLPVPTGFASNGQPGQLLSRSASSSLTRASRSISVVPRRFPHGPADPRIRRCGSRFPDDEVEHTAVPLQYPVPDRLDGDRFISAIHQPISRQTGPVELPVSSNRQYSGTPRPAQAALFPTAS